MSIKHSFTEGKAGLCAFKTSYPHLFSLCQAKNNLSMITRPKKLGLKFLNRGVFRLLGHVSFSLGQVYFDNGDLINEMVRI